MTTTDVAVIEGEIVEEPAPLSEGKAKVLDKRIRQAGTRLATEMDTLVELLNEAGKGQIHVALGYPSWTAYVKDAVQITLSDKSERKALAAFMSGKGMSNRATAAILGVDEKTVRRDTQGAADAAAVTGLDGKEYKRKPKDEEPPLDVEEVEPEVEPLDIDEVEPPEEVEPEEEPEPKPQPVSADFRNEMYNLKIDVQAFKDIMDDERFAKAAKTIAKRHMNDLQDAIKDLQGVIDALMGA